MVIKDIEDEVHVDDTDRDLPEVILVIPEKAISHSMVILRYCRNAALFRYLCVCPRFPGLELFKILEIFFLTLIGAMAFPCLRLRRCGIPQSDYSREDNSNNIAKRKGKFGRTGTVPSGNR